MASDTAMDVNSSILQKEYGVNVTSLPSCLFPFSNVHVYALVVLISIIAANTIVIYLYGRVRGLRRQPANFMLLSFAVNDILAGISLVLHSTPYLYFAVNECSNETLALQKSFRTFLDVGYLVSKLTMLSSIGHLMMLSTDRLFSLFFALKYEMYMTKRRVIMFIIITWTVSTVLAAIELGWYLMDTVLFNKIYDSLSLILFLIVPSVLLIIQYSMKIALVNRLLKTCPVPVVKRKLVANRKALTLYGLMFLSFLLLCLPYFIVRLLYAHKVITYNHIPKSMGDCIFIMRYFTSLLNPILYTFFKHDFRKALKTCLKPISRLRSSSNSSNSRNHTSQHLVTETSRPPTPESIHLDTPIKVTRSNSYKGQPYLTVEMSHLDSRKNSLRYHEPQRSLVTF